MRYFFRFCLVGSSNTILGLSVIYFCWHVLGMSDIPANILGYVIGVVWGYAINSRWTFRSARPSPQRFGRYLFTCISAYLVNLIAIGTARQVLEYQSFFPHVGGVFIYTALTYLGCRYFVFAESRKIIAPTMQEISRNS